MNTGEKIKDLRTRNNMTLEDLGKRIGVGKSTVRKWETGAIENMGRDKIAKLAAVFDVSPTYLISDKVQEMRPSSETFDYKTLLERSAEYKLAKAAEPEAKALYLTGEEDALVRCWRCASDKEKETIAFVLRDYGMPQPKTKEGRKPLTSAGA